ncbi:TPM domain-containing protein [Sphingomonas sp. GCM10030256]|uniref:TPM domain-containing protein n=1 Tax=Sphingomonas sp. GCM10030256 TaxID=3273427 RepID=UPI00361548BF
MRLLLAVTLAATAACDGSAGAGGSRLIAERDTVTDGREKKMIVSPGRIIDQAGALDGVARKALGERLDRLDKQKGVSAAVVLLKPTQGTSLEVVGWAVGGQNPNRQLLIMIEPETRQVRIEAAGQLSPEQSARVAAAMRADLARGHVRSAIENGISALERSLDERAAA